MSIYVYKCVVDDGGAPCVEDSLLTLTICKPYIRSTAASNDLIFAFGSNWEIDVQPNRLVYIAEVERSISAGAYFRISEFSHRSDCIYEWTKGRLEWRPGAAFHSRGSGINSDIGHAPTYPKANAILSKNFRYFGARGTAEWKATAPTLTKLVERLGQGHRVNFTDNLKAELLELRIKTWSRYPNKKVIGKPLHALGTRASDESEGACVAEISLRSCRTRCDEPQWRCQPSGARAD
jgi:hypothetical protein